MASTEPKENDSKDDMSRANELSSMIKTLQLELSGLKTDESDSDSISSSSLSKTGSISALQDRNLEDVTTDQNFDEGKQDLFAKRSTSNLRDELNLSRNVSERNFSTKSAEMLTSQILEEKQLSFPETVRGVEMTPTGHEDKDASISVPISTGPDGTGKVKIRFVPIGSIEPLNKMVISESQSFSVIINFVKRKTQMKHVYLYINNSFAPSGQQLVGELFDQFKVGDELCISYCGGVAFG